MRERGSSPSSTSVLVNVSRVQHHHLPLPSKSSTLAWNRARWLDFVGGGCFPGPPASTTLKNEHICSFLRVVVVIHHYHSYLPLLSKLMDHQTTTFHHPWKGIAQFQGWWLFSITTTLQCLHHLWKWANVLNFDGSGCFPSPPPSTPSKTSQCARFRQRRLFSITTTFHHFRKRANMLDFNGGGQMLFSTTTTTFQCPRNKHPCSFSRL